MIGLSATIKANALRRYQSGESCVSIAHELGMSPAMVTYLGRKHGVKRRGMLTEGAKSDIVTRYIAGEPSRSLGKAFGVTATTIVNVLKERCISFRHPAAPRRQYSLDESAFERGDEDAAYWIGFMMADGTITGPSNTVFQANVAEMDLAHLDSFKSFLGSNAPIYKINAKAWPGTGKSYQCQAGGRLQISSESLCAALARAGVVNGKVNRFVSSELATNRHFWRGVIDGDGEVSLYDHNGDANYPVISLTCWRKIVRAFYLFVMTKCPDCTARPRSIPPIFVMGINGENARILARHLYADCHIALPRKLENANRMMTQ